MNDPLYFNGRYTTTAERVLGVEDRGFQFGDAVYEVLKFLGGRPVFAEDHYRRMSNGLSYLEIENPWKTLDEFVEVCRELLRRTKPANGLIYVQVSRGECERVRPYPRGVTPTAIAYTRVWTFPDEAKKRAGIRVVTGPDLRWARCSVKSVNLLGNIIAKQSAHRAGGDECVLVRDGRITEGSSSTFFGVVEGTLVTHPADDEILRGTVRDRILGLARDEGARVEERPILFEEVAKLDEVFVTSTSQGVMPVVSIDGANVGDGSRGVLTERLQRAFDDLERRS